MASSPTGPVSPAVPAQSPSGALSPVPSSATLAPFDLGRLKASYPDLSAYRAACLHLAKACERGERFDEAARFVREIMRCTAQDGSEMTDEEKNLLYLSYKNIFHKLRGAYKLVARLHYNAVHAPAAGTATPGAGGVLPAEDKHPALLLDYRTYMEGQIQALCSEITQLMENSVIKNTSRTESKVFFSKLCGDYYRYCSEVIHDKNVRVNYEKKCFEHYSYALKLAHAQLPPNHPQRLSISLNYSVCLYELLGDRKQACDLAKNAFDAAIQKLDELDEAAYKDATLIMQLLRDNLTLWTTTAQEQQPPK